MDRGARAVVVSFFAAVWNTRAAARIGAERITVEELVSLFETAMSCPWLDFCIASTTRKERRARRARKPPPLPWAMHVVQRSGEACRGRLREAVIGVHRTYPRSKIENVREKMGLIPGRY